jgi:hypothetical protein
LLHLAKEVTMTATLGICVFPEPATNEPRVGRHANYIHEILGHAGLCYETLGFEALPTAFQNGLRVLLTIGEYALPDTIRGSLTAWTESGGAWLSTVDAEEVASGIYRVARWFAYTDKNQRHEPNQ